jgi:nitrogen-specific signal transduction histidine kinase
MVPHRIGLGLFIARAIVSAHGGHIQVSSSTESGTTFTIALPRLSSGVLLTASDPPVAGRGFPRDATSR